MKLYRFGAYGDLDNLQMVEEETPRPGAGEVLVRMRAASLNYRDLLVMRGSNVMKDNIVPLSDGAGEVVETGPGVTRFKAGDRVVGIFMQAWLSGRLKTEYGASIPGGGTDGVLTEYRVFGEQGLVRIPEHLSFEEASTLPCAGLTAWNAFYGFRPLILGDTVLALGTGGVSVFALQFAVAAGARVIITSSSDDKLEMAKKLGAHETVNYREKPEWHEEVRRLTGGEGVDHVIEAGGPGTLERSVKSARIDGNVHVIGVMAQGDFNPAVILAGRVNVRGQSVGHRERFEEMNRGLAARAIKPVIDRVFPFEEARDAYRHLQGAGHFGKIVISIG